MIITKKTIIPPKMAGVVLLPAVLMGISGDAHVAGVLMDISGDVADVVGQLQLEGYCVTATPLKKNKLGHFYYYG